jgi:hypothetical protein
MASAITESQIVGWAIEGKYSKEEAMAMATRLGLDPRPIARALGITLPASREELEALEPPAWVVTARGIRPKGEGTPDGKAFPFVWGGGCPWPVDPRSSDTKTVTETQMRRIRAKADKGAIVIISAERVKREEPAAPPQQEQRAPQQQNGRR